MLKLKSLKRWLLPLAACCLWPTQAAWSVGDVLTTPSMPTELAPTTLLIDVVEVGERLVAVGQRGHIIYSDDKGKSWSQANVPVSTLLTAVYFPDEKHGWAVGHGGLVLHSSDAGETWVKQLDGNLANEMVIAQAQERLANLELELENAEPDMQEDLEYAVEDAQFALEDAEIDAEVGPSKPLLDVWFMDKNTGFVIGAYGFFFRTTDGGKTWENWGGYVDNTERFHLNAIEEITGGMLFIVGEAGYVFRSVDYGESWETMESPYDGSLFGVSGNGNVNEVFVYGLRGNIFYSEDSGEGWSSVDVDAGETLMAAAIGKDGKMVVIGNSGVMLLSQDFGENFRVKVRDDRLALLGAKYLSDQRLLLVGESGVSILSGLQY